MSTGRNGEGAAASSGGQPAKAGAIVSPFAFLDRPSDAPILIDAAAGRVWTQAELAELVEATAASLRTDRHDVAFCLCGMDVATVVGYLAAVRAGHAVAMLDARLAPELIDSLVERYEPAFLLDGTGGERPQITARTESGGAQPAPELTVLLSTSGTTGSPKLVRLSRRNIDVHSDQIIDYLEIDEHERGIQSLPIFFSYGLSLLNTHLAAGATTILSPHSVMRPDFWEHANRWEATSFAGVPYSYSILDRTGLLRSSMPDSMRTLTQSGARLGPEKIAELNELITSRGGRMFVMYGLTETTARISYTPVGWLPEKAHTVGVPIRDTEVSILVGETETTEPDVEGEVIFRGPNVMLGYAWKRDDLALGDVLGGELHTGDLGALDADGFLRLTGRSNRIAKIYGLRVNLDEIEAAASTHGPVAAVEGEDQIVLWRLPTEGLEADDLRRELARRFNLNSRAFVVREVDSLPTTGRGKYDYVTLAKRSATA